MTRTAEDFYTLGKHDAIGYLQEKAASLHKLGALARDAGPHQTNVAYALDYQRRAAAISFTVRVAMHIELHFGGLDWNDAP